MFNSVSQPYEFDMKILCKKASTAHLRELFFYPDLCYDNIMFARHVFPDTNVL